MTERPQTSFSLWRRWQHCKDVVTFSWIRWDNTDTIWLYSINQPALGQLFANSWVILFLQQLSHLVDIDIPCSYNYQGPKVVPRLALSSLAQNFSLSLSLYSPQFYSATHPEDPLKRKIQQLKSFNIAILQIQILQYYRSKYCNISISRHQNFSFVILQTPTAARVKTVLVSPASPAGAFFPCQNISAGKMTHRKNNIKN